MEALKAGFRRADSLRLAHDIITSPGTYLVMGVRLVIILAFVTLMLSAFIFSIAMPIYLVYIAIRLISHDPVDVSQVLGFLILYAVFCGGSEWLAKTVGKRAS
jgi:hypothetical protein